MRMTAEQLKYQQDAIRNDQERYNHVLAKIGEQARAPVLGESRNDYRREQLREIKRRHLQNHKLYTVNMRGLQADALDASSRRSSKPPCRSTGIRATCRSAKSMSARDSTISATCNPSSGSAKKAS